MLMGTGAPSVRARRVSACSATRTGPGRRPGRRPGRPGPAAVGPAPGVRGGLAFAVLLTALGSAVLTGLPRGVVLRRLTVAVGSALAAVLAGLLGAVLATAVLGALFAAVLLPLSAVVLGALSGAVLTVLLSAAVLSLAAAVLTALIRGAVLSTALMRAVLSTTTVAVPGVLAAVLARLAIAVLTAAVLARLTTAVLTAAVLGVLAGAVRAGLVRAVRAAAVLARTVSGVLVGGGALAVVARSAVVARRGAVARGAPVVALLRGAFLLRPAAGPQELDHDRHHRDEHDQDEDHLDVLVHEVDLAEGRAQYRHADAPEDAADDVVRDERAVVHPADTGDDRRERPDDGDEAGQHQRLRSVLLEELVGLLDVLLLEETGVRPLEEGRPHLAAEEIADLVTDDRRQGDQETDEPQGVLQVSGRHQKSCGEQQGVTGQEEADEQSGLGEHDEQESGQPEGVEQIIRVQPARAERKRIQGSGLQGWSVCAAAWPPQAINAAADAWVPLA